MDNSAFTDWTFEWRKRLSQSLYVSRNFPDQIEEISRSAQFFLIKNIILQMLYDKGLPDVEFGNWLPDIEAGIFGDKLRPIQKELSEMDFSAASFEVLGDIYESHLAMELMPNSIRELEYIPRDGHKKGRGIYYTPKYIVHHIVDQTLGKYLSVRTPDDISNLRILDPACGSGSFLTYIFDILMKFYKFHDKNSDRAFFILKRHLYGVDTDSNAVDISSMILTLKASEYASQPPDKYPKLNIEQGNFLVPINEDEDKKFTMILGNPPYGARLSKVERAFIKSNYETCRSPDSSSLFVEKAVKSLEADGILGFILPKSLSYVVSWRSIREYLLNNCKIMEIADARKAFKGVLLEQMVIIAQKSIEQSASTDISMLQPENSGTSHSIDGSALSTDRFSIWLSSDRLRNIVDKIWEKSVPLGEIAEIWNGLTIQSTLPSLGEPGSQHKYPCLRGRDIQRYHIRQDIRYVRITDVMQNCSLPLDKYYRPKILAQDIVAHIFNPQPHIKITATIDRTGNWLNMNTVTNIASSEYPLEYLCGILNSRFISWYAYDLIYNRSIRTMHFRRGYADHIPICCVLNAELIDHVNRIIALHEKKATESEIDEVDKKIGRLIYQIYDISEEDAKFLKHHAGLHDISIA